MRSPQLRQPTKILLLALLAWSVCSCSAKQGESEKRNVGCADRDANAFVWEDLDSDGQIDDTEPPLPGICITFYRIGTDDEKFDERCYQDNAPEYLYTNKSGEWRSEYLVAGSCYGTEDDIARAIREQCESIVIVVYPPKGYAPTTETTTIGCDAEFGFVKVGE